MKSGTHGRTNFHMHYILESTFARIFLYLELTFQRETHIYINLHNWHTLFLLSLSTLGNYFILIGHLKHCVKSRRANREIRAKVDSWCLYWKGKLLLMGSWWDCSAVRTRLQGDDCSFPICLQFLCKIEKFEITLLKGYNPDKQVGSFYITTTRFPVDEVSSASLVIQ